MLEEEVKTWLHDILICIREIEEFFAKQPVTFEEYKQNTLLKRAVERNFEIIGEAVNRILKIRPAIQITEAKAIVTLRNKVIHAYHRVSHEILWAIIHNDLPLLKKEVETLLQQ